jgi:hypothetical protein
MCWQGRKRQGKKTSSWNSSFACSTIDSCFVCVWERDRDRNREREKEKQRKSQGTDTQRLIQSVFFSKGIRRMLYYAIV